MPRYYDIVKTPQDLTYLTWDERTTPSGALGAHPKAREGSGAHAVIYQLPRTFAMPGHVNPDLLCQLLSSRLMELLGIPHAPITLIRAYVQRNHRTELTWLTKTRPNRRPNQQKASLDQIFGTMGYPEEDPLEFCRRNGWLHQVSALFLVDYLSANRSRTGSQIEVLRNPDGSLEFAPLLPSSECFTTSFRMQMWKSRALEPVRANYFLGSQDAASNLLLMDPSYSCTPLSTASRAPFVAGLEGIADGANLKGAWIITWKRWQAFQKLLNSQDRARQEPRKGKGGAYRKPPRSDDQVCRKNPNGEGRK